MNLELSQARIRELMSIFVAQVKAATAMNRADINNLSENVLIPLFAEVFGYVNLKNLNQTERANYPAIDLGDEKERVAIQVTSESDSEKIKGTLEKFVQYRLYEKYDRLIIYILTEKCWRRLKIDHPYRLKIDQGELLYSVLYSIGIVDQTELVLPPFFY